MPSTEATFRDRYGLHPRAANRILTTAREFHARVTLQRAGGGSPVDAGSLLGLVSSSIRTGDGVRISAEGDDAEAAIGAVAALLEAGVCHPER
ncbi:MAG TPA: HPr family phosphocarrier protein [Candidatus Limnocylindrales bacterium]|nr:HPr family phosphocarrier protein [Candidatus Limnocylindrales bacterium]